MSPPLSTRDRLIYRMIWAAIASIPLGCFLFGLSEGDGFFGPLGAAVASAIMFPMVLMAPETAPVAWLCVIVTYFVLGSIILLKPIKENS